MLLGGRHDTETRSSARIPRTMMAAVAYATEFGAATTRSGSTGAVPMSYKTATYKPVSKKKTTQKLNPPSKEKGKRIQTERAASKTRNLQKIRKGIAFLAAVASTKPKYGGLRITGEDPFVEFRKENNELFSKRVLQMIHHYTGIDIGWSSDSIRPKSNNAVSDEEKYHEGEQARLRLFFLCELAFNEAKFITKGVTDNMISRRTITDVMNDLVTAAVSELGNLDEGLGYDSKTDSTTKREQDLYRAISVIGKEADLFKKEMYDSATNYANNAHKLFEKLANLGFDSQFSSKTEKSETESTRGLWIKEEFDKILEKLGNTKYRHTEEIIGNTAARTAETETAETSVIGSITDADTINTSPRTGGDSNANKGQKGQKGKKEDQPQSNSAENDTSQGTLDANSKKVASVAKQKGVLETENAKKMATKKGDAMIKADDTSKTPAAENVALVNLDSKIYDKLTKEGIVNPERTYHVHGLSYLHNDDHTNTLIVEPDAISEDIEGVIKKYIAWQEQKTPDRIVIFLDRESALWKHMYNYPSEYRLFWAKLDFGYMYCVKAKTDQDFDTSQLSKFINERLSSKTDNLIKWNLNEEDPDYNDQDRAGTEDENDDGSGIDSYQEEDARIETGTKKNPVKAVTAAKEAPIEVHTINPSDPIQIAIQKVVKKGTDASSYETIREITEELNEDFSLIFVVLPETSKEGKKGQKTQEDTKKKYLDTFLDWQEEKGRLVVFVASNGDPGEQYFIDYAQKNKKNSSVFVYTNESVSMYCIVEGPNVEHDLVDGEKWKQVVVPDESEPEVPGEEEEETENIEVLGIEGEEADYLAEVITEDGVYTSYKDYQDPSTTTLLLLVWLMDGKIETIITKYMEWQDELRDERLAVFVDTNNDESIKQKAVTKSKGLGRKLYISNIKIEGKNASLYCFGAKAPDHKLLDSNIRWTKYRDQKPSEEDQRGQYTSIQLTYGEEYYIPVGVLSKHEIPKSTQKIADFLSNEESANVIVVRCDNVFAYAIELARAEADKKMEKEEGKKEKGVETAQKKTDVIKSLIEKGEVIVFLCKDDTEWTGVRHFAQNKQGTDRSLWLTRLPGDKGNQFNMAVRCVRGKEVEIGHGWFPISKMNLTDQGSEPSQTIKIEQPYDYSINIYTESEITKRIRDAGIRMALDYVSSEARETNNKAICRPNDKKDKIQNLMTKAQELVYLTLSSHDPVRIYALAPGAGKTRCMALALFCSMLDIGVSSKYCVVMHSDDMMIAYDQIVKEIMASIYDGDNPVIEHVSGARDITTEIIKKKEKMDTILKGTDVGEKRKRALKLAIEELNRKKITLLTPNELEKEIGKGDLPYGCIIADECHHIIGTLASDTNKEKVNKVKRFIGFSATPFNNNGDLESIRSWARRMSVSSAQLKLKSTVISDAVSLLGKKTSDKAKQSDAEKAKKDILDILNEVKTKAANEPELQMVIDNLIQNPVQKVQKKSNGASNKDESITESTDAIDELRLIARTLENASTVDHFVKSSVVYADEHDGVHMLPYATIEYKTIVTEGPDVTVSGNELFAVTIKQDKDQNDMNDYNEEFDDDDYGAAINKVLELLLNQKEEPVLARSLVYIRNGAKITTLLNTVAERYKEYHVAKNADEFTKLNGKARSKIILVDIKKEKKGKKKSEGKKKEEKEKTDRDKLRRVFNHVNDEKLADYRMIVTNNDESIEYYGVPNMYIIDIPTDRKECIQARNRAFRVCSHYKVPQAAGKPKPKHTVNYVLVARKDKKRDVTIHRGSLAVANAHTKDQSGSLLAGAERLYPSGTVKSNGITVTGKPSLIATYLIDTVREEYRNRVADPDRFAQYAEKKEINIEGAVTVFDVSSYLKQNKNKHATAYDGRIQRLLAVTQPQSSAVAFDEPGGLYCAHHTLRGITFEHKDALPETDEIQKMGNGTLILRYSGTGDGSSSSGSSSVVVHIHGETSPVRLENALGSTTVYTGVRTVYYADAHKIQCIGHARFECFRAIGAIEKGKIKPPKRVFVGTQERFRAFIGMMSSGYGYRGNCTDDAREKKYTPMVIAMELRRVLLAGYSCVVSISNSLGYKENLALYLKNELNVGEWYGLINVTYIDHPDDDVSITVQRDGKQIDTKAFSVSASEFAKTVHDKDTTKDDKDTKKDEDVKSDVLYVLSTDKYDEKEYNDCTNTDFAPTIDLRTTGKKKKFKTRAGHHSNLRCTMVIFVGTITDWDTTRIEARKYCSKG